MPDKDNRPKGYGRLSFPKKEEKEGDTNEEKLKKQIDQLIRSGRQLIEVSDFRGSLEKTAQALELATEINYKSGMAYANFSMGILYFEAGDYGRSLNYFTECLKLYEELGRMHMVGSTYYEMGMALKAIGEYDEALKMYELSMQLADTPDDIILCYHQIGNLLFDRAQYDDALKMYLDALEKVKAEDLAIHSKKKTLAILLHEIGLVYVSKEELEKAAKYVTESLELKKEINYVQGIAKSYHLLGNIFLQRENYEKARKYFNEGVAIADQIGQPSDKSAYLESVSHSYYNQGNLEESEKYLLEAKAIRERLGEKDNLCTVLLNLGAIASQKKEYDRALEYYQQSLELAEKIGLAFQFAKTLQGLAKLYLRQDKFSESVKYYKEALTAFESIISAMKSAKDRIKYREMYAEEIPLMISRILAHTYTIAPKPELLVEALGYIELAKSREVISGAAGGCPQCDKRAELSDDIEAIREKLVELDNQIRADPENKQLRAERAKFLEQLWNLEEIIWKICEDPQGMIPIENPVEIIKKFFATKQEPGTIILEFMYIYKQIDVYLIQDNQIQYEEIEISEEVYEELYQLAVDIGNIRMYLMSGESDEAEKLLDDLSRRLYASLIPEAMRETLKEAKSLIIIPHAFLHNFPFEITHDGDEYWGLKYNLSQAFSLELLRISQAKQKSKKAKQPEVFMVGNPNKGEYFDTKEILGTEERGQMKGDLPGAEAEVKKLSNLAREYKWRDYILLNEKATADEFLRKINEIGFSIFHFAGHAIFRPEDPSLSCFLLRNNERIVVDEIINKICFKENPLVVLSSCESGTTRAEGADELIGLSRALLLAGAPTMVLSRWLVMDEPTHLLMEAFYRNLFEKKSISESMKLARININENIPSKYRNVMLLILGSFTVLGAPGPLNF